MKSALTFFVKYLHVFIILKAGADFYSDFMDHNDIIDQKTEQIPIIERKIKKVERDVQLIKSFKRDLANSKRKVESVASQIQKIQKQLPNEIDDNQILAVLLKEAELINIKDVRLSPGSEVANGFYFTKPYNITGRGTFLQLLIFFERLANRERILNISKLEVTESEKDQKGRFQIVELVATLEAYRYNQSYKEQSGVKQIEDSFKKNRKTPRKSKRRRTKRK